MLSPFLFTEEAQFKQTRKKAGENTMRSIVAAVCVFAFVFFLPSPLPALETQDTPRLEGVVLKIDGLPSSGTQITAWDGRTRYTTATDKDGTFTIEGISPGSIFALRLSPKKFPSVRIDGFRFPEQGNLFFSAEHGTMSKGKNYTSKISSNPTTGYSWSLLDSGNESVMILRENSMEQPQEIQPRGFVGRGGRELWTFEAVGRGINSAVLGYRRSWETGVSPRRYHILILNVR